MTERLHKLALAIADGSARSDIECYAHMKSMRNYDLTRAQDDLPGADPDQATQVAIVQLAVEYIELRGDALPYRLVRTGDFGWFEDREPTAISGESK